LAASISTDKLEFMPSKKVASVRPQRRRTYHHGDLRRALLDASLEIIEKEGVSNLTLRDAARRAGVSHAAPKHHFGDLRGLHCAIAEEGYHKLRGHMTRARDAEPEAGALRAFKLIGMAYVDFAARHPGHFRAMFHPEVADRSDEPSLDQAAQAAYQLLLDVVHAAQAAGEIRADDTRDLALGAWSLVHGLAALAVDCQLANKGFSSTDPVALADALTDQLYRGMRGER
jgi:AcrR family transcriptional regulator